MKNISNEIIRLLDLCDDELLEYTLQCRRNEIERMNSKVERIISLARKSDKTIRNDLKSECGPNLISMIGEIAVYKGVDLVEYIPPWEPDERCWRGYDERYYRQHFKGLKCNHKLSKSLIKIVNNLNNCERETLKYYRDDWLRSVDGTITALIITSCNYEGTAYTFNFDPECRGGAELECERIAKISIYFPEVITLEESIPFTGLKNSEVNVNSSEVLDIRKKYDAVFNEIISNAMKNEKEWVAAELFKFELNVKLHSIKP